jgi:hypothetical protein
MITDNSANLRATDPQNPEKNSILSLSKLNVIKSTQISSELLFYNQPPPHLNTCVFNNGYWGKTTAISPKLENVLKE